MRSAALLLLLSGCLAPKYVRPEAPVPETFPTEASAAASTPDWEGIVADEGLRQLVSIALEENRDLRATALAVESARAQLRLATSALGPSLDVSAVYSNTHVPASVSPFDQAYDVERFQVGPDVSWELDLFGRLRSQRRAAAERTVASAEDWRSARLALIAEVVGTALSEKVQARQLELARETARTRRDTLDLVSTQVEAGIADELALTQAEALVYTADANAAQLERTVAQTHNALVLLLGRSVPRLEAAEDPGALVSADIPAGLPSDLLQNRPDVRAAERRLVAAHADIGAARAAFFPSISLTGSLNTASSSLTGLFAPDTLAWNFTAPSLVQPIFRWGQNRANLKAANVQRDALIAQYEGSIQAAFREVADVLVAVPTLAAEEEARERVAEVQEERLSIANARYEAGVDSYLQVLDAERERYAADQTLLSVRLQRAQLALSLFRVVGGGVEGEAPLPDGAEVPKTAMRTEP